MNFADNVKQVRAQLKMTQEELAHELGVSFATVNRWEKGAYHPSRLAKKTFENFCKEKKITNGDADEKTFC